MNTRRMVCTLCVALFCISTWNADSATCAAAGEREYRVSAVDVSLTRHTQDCFPAAQPPERSERDFSEPANDNCADAIPLSGNVTWLPFFTVGATDDGPVPSCQPDTHRNIWYVWTAEEDGTVEVNTEWCVWDTVLTAYEGDDCSNLVEIACNDDGCGGGAQSRIQFDVVGGQSYLISVGGWHGNAGGGLLVINMVDPPPTGACCVGDECTDNTSLEECVLLDGTWYFDAECAQYVCGDCPEDVLTIGISFTAHPEETSWELIEEGSGAVIGSGNYSVGSDPSLLAKFCLDHDSCYTFTIFDSAGNGLLGQEQEYESDGFYSLDLNGLLIASGSDFGSSETTRLGYGCGFPSGACCVAGECVGTMIELECAAQYGTFFAGEDCDTFSCPRGLSNCSETAIFGQDLPIHAPGLMRSDAGLGSTFPALVADKFSDLSAPIYGVDWWGVWRVSGVGNLVPCDTVDPTVEIKFYEDAGDQPGDVVCQYTLPVTWEPSGVFTLDGFEILRFSVDLLQPACNLSTGWVSVQGVGNELTCAFMWATSNDGDHIAYQLQPMLSRTFRDMSFCLDSDYEPVLGACCDDATGTCLEGIERIDCYGRFAADLSCGELFPPCGEVAGACCRGDGTCDIVIESACSGTWLGDGATCDACPCVLVRPAGALVEAEGCGDTVNDGCLMGWPAFAPITPGLPVWGTLWADGGERDTDWYRVVTTQSTLFTWTVEADFENVPVVGGFVPTTPLGTPDCSTVSVLDPFAGGDACEPASITTVCLPAGTYWFFVAPFALDGLPCGENNHYIAMLTAEPCVIMGACCYNDGNDCADNSEAECNALGGTWFLYETCDEHTCLTPCPEAAIDVEILTDDMPIGTTWSVTDALTGDVVDSGGPYEEAGRLYIQRVCVPADRCFTFTINDDWGNGVCCYDGQGYYRVYYQGGVVRSGDQFGEQDSFDMGVACPARPGACCVAGECVGDMTQADCATLSGSWNEEVRCADGHDCTGEVDYRLQAPIIDLAGNTCNKGDDCNLHVAEDVEYLISIPEEGLWGFSLCGSNQYFDSWIALGSTRCGADIGFDEDYCLTHPELVRYVAAGDYYLTIDGYNALQCGPYVLNVRKYHECDGECPPDATPEAEPLCYGGYTDTTNGGCDVSPAVFIPIGANETVCGTSGTYLSQGQWTKDNDWYVFELFGPAQLKWEVCATFDVDVSIWGSNTGDCEGEYGIAYTHGPANDLVSTGAVLTTGVYWLRVSPTQQGGVPCGSPYVATLLVEPLANIGACCNAWTCITLGDEDQCLYEWVGEWHPGETCVEDGGDFVCPGAALSACCMPDGFCLMLGDELECIFDLGGAWYPGETCVDYGGEFVCPATSFSACCMSDGYCMMVGDEMQCLFDWGGEWYEGETCMDNGGSFVCPGGPAYSACCTFDGSCVMLTDEFECTVIYEGTWHEGELCVENGGSLSCSGGTGWCDLDGNSVVDYDDYIIFLAAFGGPVDGNPPEDAACDFDDSGAVGLEDYSAWLECYREFSGDPLAGPPSTPDMPTPGLNGQGGVQKKDLPAAESDEAVQPAAGNGNAQTNGAIKKLPR